MDYQADDSKYGLITKSEATGTIVVFPNGYSRRDNGRLATWNAGQCCGPAHEANVDDVGFIRAMLIEVRKKLNVDGDRIFATGMSNGGLMAYRLACEMSDVFRAIAPVAGTDNTLECTPSRPVSVLHIHAKNDSHVLFEGGAGPDAFKSAVNEFTSVPATISKWTKINGCASPPKRTQEVKGAYCERYEPCESASLVELCVTESGGHSWPGGQKRRGETPSKAISATDTMWEFFESVSR
jgi:polyhydroxybutyrate depolymerase